jgi:SAM-dependent methyltransferase
MKYASVRAPDPKMAAMRTGMRSAGARATALTRARDSARRPEITDATPSPFSQSHEARKIVDPFAAVDTMASLARFRKLALAADPAARRIRAEIQRIASTLAPADSVLDLGSGEAPYADLFPHRYYVTADLFAGADVRCDATALPFRGDGFDLVLCTEVLEHVPDPEATMGEIQRVLRERGTLVLTTPLTWGVHAPHDFHRWTDSGLVKLLGRHGFRVRLIRSRGGVFLVLAAILLVIPWQAGEAQAPLV